ncbi:MAG: hypothetical protein E6J74_00215 [Deltaproteobacteria bacterium]|nr:MAG: hypothetical protein E6J74_00215 [Deltaproteobacteria bacterium]
MQMIPNARTTNRYTAIANLVFVALTALGLVFPLDLFALDQVHVHVSAGISPNTLLYRFTKEKGFYREEGMDALLIQAGMLPGIQGLVGGSFHFSQILGQGAGGILRGLPLKIVMVFDTRRSIGSMQAKTSTRSKISRAENKSRSRASAPPWIR